jgi:hypothetical protein
MINERCTNDLRIRGEWWIYTMNNLCYKIVMGSYDIKW